MELETIPAVQARPKRVRKTTPKRQVKQPKELTATPGATGGITYVARRPVKIGDRKYMPGEVVPGAASWTRVESWVRAGYIDPVEV